MCCAVPFRPPVLFADPSFTIRDHQLLTLLGGAVLPSQPLQTLAVPGHLPHPQQHTGNSTLPHPNQQCLNNPPTVLTNIRSASHTPGATADSTSANVQPSHEGLNGSHLQPSQEGVSASALGNLSGLGDSHKQRVLLYMPCCPRHLYGEVVELNLRAGTLPRVAILGNSFSALADSNALLQVRPRAGHWHTLSLALPFKVSGQEPTAKCHRTVVQIRICCAASSRQVLLGPTPPCHSVRAGADFEFAIYSTAVKPVAGSSCWGSLHPVT